MKRGTSEPKKGEAKDKKMDQLLACRVKRGSILMTAEDGWEVNGEALAKGERCELEAGDTALLPARVIEGQRDFIELVGSSVSEAAERESALLSKEVELAEREAKLKAWESELKSKAAKPAEKPTPPEK